MAYNLGSVCKSQERWAPARRAFEHALALTPPADTERVGGCHFHLGEIALAQDDPRGARAQFAHAIEAVPNHGKARARLDALAVS
jgi:TolA-binding protein